MERDLIIIACDPGYSKPHAFSVFKGNQLQKTYYTKDYLEIYDIFIKWGADLTVLEDQFFGRNIKTLKDLARETGKICGILEIMVIPYEFVGPSVWQNWHKLPKKPKDISAYKWKKIHTQQQIDLAYKLTGAKPENDDCAASVLIGLFAIGRNNDN